MCNLVFQKHNHITGVSLFKISLNTYNSKIFYSELSVKYIVINHFMVDLGFFTNFGILKIPGV